VILKQEKKSLAFMAKTFLEMVIAIVSAKLAKDAALAHLPIKNLGKN
jgi:hypothetical protein